jgi:hypothetical protein
MERHLTRIGVWGSIIYTLILLYLVGGRLSTLQAMPLNEVGDFLAGVFGPLTVYWLVLGFFQQGIELRLNTNALELQAKELQHSVEQQRELVDVAKKQFQADLQSLNFERQRVDASFRPRLIIEQIMKSKEPSGELTFIVHFRNMGYTVVNAEFELNPAATWLDPSQLASWETGFVFKLRVTLPHRDNSTRVLKIRYAEVSGTKGIRLFTVAPSSIGVEAALLIEPLDIGDSDLASVLSPSLKSI